MIYLMFIAWRLFLLIRYLIVDFLVFILFLKTYYGHTEAYVDHQDGLIKTYKYKHNIYIDSDNLFKTHYHALFRKITL